MTNTVQTYLNLITSEHDTKPNFMATVALSVAVYVQIQNVLNSMIPLFDLSTPPVGNQLDIIGQWVGISRDIENPFSNIFFTWDGTASNGWDFGIWQSPGNPGAITVLPDDVYLTVILAKIAANNWNGTTTGLYAIWDHLFPSLTLLIEDHQNMHYSVGLVGYPPDSLTLALLLDGNLIPRPEGVMIDEYFIPVDTRPLFSWDTETAYMKGWDEASWARELAPT